MKRRNLFVATLAAGAASVVLAGGFGSIPCAGDATGDGEVDFNDFVQVLADWGTCDFAPKDAWGFGKDQQPVIPTYMPCPSDMTGDHLVDFQDLLVVLNRYGTDCVKQRPGNK